jgi:rhodanese-related sulfurtransferase
MTPQELAARIAEGRAPAILDVRSRREFQRGHVPGAVHRPFWLLPFRTDVPFRRDEPMVIYCGHGPRAWFAASALRCKGYGRVSYLTGHMAAWQRANLPITRPVRSA